jgi:hypothetical protein
MNGDRCAREIHLHIGRLVIDAGADTESLSPHEFQAALQSALAQRLGGVPAAPAAMPRSRGFGTSEAVAEAVAARVTPSVNGGRGS